MAISYVSSGTGTNSIASMPSHQAGDLLIFFAYRDGSTTNPTLPAGFTSITAPDGTSSSTTVGYKIAASGSETSGTWTNATSLICHVYRSSSGSVFPGAVATNTGSSTTVNYPALTLNNTGGSSWVLGFAGCNQSNMSLETAPSLMTNRSTVSDATDEAAGADTNGGVTSWSSTNVSVGGTSGPWTTAVIEIAESAITYIGSATAAATTVTLPTHQAGDLILIFAFRDSSSTAPSLPSGYTSKATASSDDFDGAAMRLGYKIAASGSETSGTWTNATQLVCHVYRGVDQTTPLGASGGTTRQTQGTTTASYPTLTLSVANGTSWIAGFGGSENTTSAIDTAPAGMVQRATATAASSEVAGFDTFGGRAAWTAQTVALGGSNYDWIVRNVEILAGVTEITLTTGNSNQLNTSSAAAITQEHVLTTGNSAQVNTSSAAAITQIHATTSGDAAQLNTAASGAISQEHALTTGNSDQINSVADGAISQEHVLTSGNADQVNAVTDGAISQELTLTAGNSDQLNTSSADVITQEHILTSGDSDQVNTASSGEISTILTLVSGDSAQVNESTEESISQEHILTAGNSDQVNLTDDAAITQEQILVAGDCDQVNTISEDAIQQGNTLTAEDANQINVVSEAVITQEHILVAENSDQINEASSGGIDQEHFLTSGDADQVNEVSEDSISLTITLESGDSDQLNQSASAEIIQEQTLTAGNADQLNIVTGGSVGVTILTASNVAQINTITPLGEIRLEQIMNLQLLYKNDFDDATAAATSSASGFPLTNAGANSKASVWRSTSLSSQTISGDWAGTAKTINCVALAFTNLIEGSTVRVKLYQEIADVSPYYDSGVRTVWFAYDPPDGFTTIGLIAFPFGGGVHFPVFFNAATVKKFEIIVTSSGNPDGYIEVGRVLIGNAWSPEHNAEYGATIGHVDESEINRTAGGQYVDRRGMHKTISFDLRYLSDSDRSELSSIVRRNGKRSPVFVSMYPDETDEIFQNGNLFGYFRDPAQFEHVMHSAHDTKVDIDEI